MFSFKTYIRPLKALEQRTAVMSRLLAAFLALPDEVVSPLHLCFQARMSDESQLAPHPRL